MSEEEELQHIDTLMTINEELVEEEMENKNM